MNAKDKDLCRATAEQAGKVEMADCCDTPHYCSSVRRCTRDDAKPTQPAATQQPVAEIGALRWKDNPQMPDWHAIPVEHVELWAGNPYVELMKLRIDPHLRGKVEALAVKWRGIAKQQRIAADRDDDRGDTESAARMRGMAERSEYCANEIEYICALAPVQEKAP